MLGTVQEEDFYFNMETVSCILPSQLAQDIKKNTEKVSSKFLQFFFLFYFKILVLIALVFSNKKFIMFR